MLQGSLSPITICINLSQSISSIVHLQSLPQARLCCTQSRLQHTTNCSPYPCVAIRLSSPCCFTQFHPDGAKKKKKFSGSEVWPSFGLTRREVMHAKEVQRFTPLPEQDHQSTIICLSILLLPRLTFKVCNNSGIPLALSGSKVMHVFIIALGTAFRKHKSWMGWSY